MQCIINTTTYIHIRIHYLLVRAVCRTYTQDAAVVLDISVAPKIHYHYTNYQDTKSHASSQATKHVLLIVTQISSFALIMQIRLCMSD